MDISIDSKKENALLGRREVGFSVSFSGAIPSREQVRQALSSALLVQPAARIVVVKLDSKYGSHALKGFAYAYESEENAKSAKKHLLVRDKIIEKEEKKKKAAAPKRAAK